MSSRIYVKNPNGTVYVYENESFWDKQTKKTKHRRKCIGKLDNITGEVVPTRKKGDLQQAKTELPATCSMLTIGPTLLLDKAAEESGLLAALELVFPEEYKQILACAYYLACEGKSICRLRQWVDCTKNPCGENTEIAFEELLEKITSLQQQKFFGVWLDKASRSSCVIHDITSVFSLSGLVDMLREGYDRSSETAPRTHIFAVTDKITHLPLCYRVTAGAPKDIISLRDRLSYLDGVDVKVSSLVLNRKFYDEDNIDALFINRMSFSIEMPLGASIARSAIAERIEDMDFTRNLIQLGNDELYGTTKTIKWKGNTCYLHTYYDRISAKVEGKEFIHKLKTAYEELAGGYSSKRKQAFYEKYFIIKERPKRGRKVQYNEEAIRRYQETVAGWKVILSNSEADAKAALRLFRDRAAAERNFDDLRNEPDRKRLLVNTNAAVSARLFLQFIALILVTYLHNVLDASGIINPPGLAEIFTELKGIRQVKLGDGNRLIQTKISDKQRMILDLFAVDAV